MRQLRYTADECVLPPVRASGSLTGAGVSIGSGDYSNPSAERSAIHIQLGKDADSDSSGMNFSVHDKPSHPQSNPLNFDLTPAVLNRWINKKLSDIDAAAKASALLLFANADDGASNCHSRRVGERMI